MGKNFTNFSCVQGLGVLDIVIKLLTTKYFHSLGASSAPYTSGVLVVKNGDLGMRGATYVGELQARRLFRAEFRAELRGCTMQNLESGAINAV